MVCISCSVCPWPAALWGHTGWAGSGGAGLVLAVLGWQARSSMHGCDISDLQIHVFLSHLI